MRAKHAAWTLAIIPVLHGAAAEPVKPKVQVQILVDISGSVRDVNPLRIAANLVGKLHDCNGVAEGSVLYEVNLMAGHVEQILPSPQPGAENRVRALASELDDFRKHLRDTVAGFSGADLDRTDFYKVFDAVGKFLRIGAGPDIPRKAVWLISDGEHDPYNKGAQELAFSHLREKASVPFDLVLIYTGSPARLGQVEQDWVRGTSREGLLNRSQAPWIHFMVEEDANNLQHLGEELIDRAIIEPVFTLEEAYCTEEPAGKDESSLRIVANTKMDSSLINTGYPKFAQACWDEGRKCAPLAIGLISTGPVSNPLEVGFQLRLLGLQPGIPPPSFTLDLQKPGRFHWPPWIWRRVTCHPEPWMSLDWWTGAPSWVVNPSFRAKFHAVDAAHPGNSSTMPVTAIIGSQMGEAAVCSVTHNDGKMDMTEDLTVESPVHFFGPVTVLCPLPDRQSLLSLLSPASQPFPVRFRLNATTPPIPIVARRSLGRMGEDDDDNRYSLRSVWFGWPECGLLFVAVFFWITVYFFKSRWKACTWKVCEWENLCAAFAIVCAVAIPFLARSGVLEILKSPLYNSSVCQLYWIEWAAAIVIAAGCILCSRKARGTHPRIGTGLLCVPCALALVGFGWLAVGVVAEEIFSNHVVHRLFKTPTPPGNEQPADKPPEKRVAAVR